MDFWTVAALLFCVGLISSYWTLFRPELLHMSPVRRVVLAFATVISLVYGFSMAHVLDIARYLHTLPLAIMLLLSSAASAALIVEMIRVAFFREATWRDKFHFSIVVFCWVALFLLQFALVDISRSGLSQG